MTTTGFVILLIVVVLCLMPNLFGVFFVITAGAIFFVAMGIISAMIWAFERFESFFRRK